MNNPTLELIQLQTICLAHGESIIDDNGNYKKTPDALKAISSVWNKVDEKLKSNNA